MSKLSRRDFMTLAGAAASTVALGACNSRDAVQGTPAPVTPSPPPGVLVTASGYEMVRVEGGSFERGSMGGKQDEQFPHTVTITRPYYVGKYPVTFGEYEDFCRDVGKSRPDVGNWGRGNYPVCGLNWYDAVAYCNWLSAREGLSACYDIDALKGMWDSAQPSQSFRIAPCYHAAPGNGYRLPTEAEWEFAARGAQKSRGYLYAGSDDPDEVGWYAGNSDGHPHPTGQKAPNELGLYDMSGNVWEFCWDLYAWNCYYFSSFPENESLRTDPMGLGPPAHVNRVLRGGCFSSEGDDLRTAARGYDVPLHTGIYGFRLAITL